MAVEYRLVNDNGVQKVIKLDITEPKKKGMSADTTATIVNGDVRTILPLKGDAPISSEEVSIEEWAPTYPGSLTNTWKSTTRYLTDQEIPGLIKRVRGLLKLPNRLSNGGWLSKFDLGGTVQQPESDKQKRMKELLLIINGAAKELSTKQPGDNVAYLAQVMQDPQEAELIEALVAEIPDAQEIIDQVNQLSSQMFKCGGKTKKKVKKGAKGCVPCKKLMKVGGKLINVWSDCEGRIIHKNAKGGWIVKAENGIPGGFAYGDLNLLTFADISKTTGQEGDFKYYFDPTTNQLMKTTWDATNNKWNAGARTDETITAGIGDGQVNLWKEGYNPETGLFPGETVTYTDKLGIKGKGYTTKAVENNNLVTINQSGNAAFLSVQGTTTPDKNISYMPKAWRVNRALRDQRRELYYRDLLNGATVDDAKTARKIQKSIDKNYVYGRNLSPEAAAAVSDYNTKNPNDQIYTVKKDGLSYKKLRQTKNAGGSGNSTPNILVEKANPQTTSTGAAAYVNPTKIRAAYRSKGGWLNKFN